MHLLQKGQQVGQTLLVDRLFQSLGHKRLAAASDLIDILLQDRLSLPLVAPSVMLLAVSDRMMPVIVRPLVSTIT